MGVGERDAYLAGLGLVGGLGGAVGAEGEVGEGGGEGFDLGDVGGVEDGVETGELPADELDGEAGAEDDAGGFGVDPDVELGGGGDVAFAAGRAAHDDAVADVGED